MKKFLVGLGVLTLVGIISLGLVTYQHRTTVELVTWSTVMGQAIADENYDKATGTAYSVARAIHKYADTQDESVSYVSETFVETFAKAFKETAKVSGMDDLTFARRWALVKECLLIIEGQTHPKKEENVPCDNLSTRI